MLFYDAAVISGLDDSFFHYEENVSIKCLAAGGAGPYTFIWEDPDGSDSLIRDTTSFQNDSFSSILMFVAVQEDSGEYKCRINGTDPAVVATVTITIGNFIMLSIYSSDL